MTLPCDARISSPRDYVCYVKANWKKFKRLLLNSSWSNLNVNCIEDTWKLFVQNINHAINLSIPRQEKKTWSPLNNSKCRSALRKHRRLYRTYCHAPTLVNKVNCLYSQTLINSRITGVIYLHEKKLAKNTKHNPKAFWSYVNQRFKTNRTFSVMKDDNGRIMSDPLSIAETFNHVFCSYFNPSPSSQHVPITPSYDASTPDIDASFLGHIQFSPDIVFNCIKSLPSSISCDLDNICYLTVKRGDFFLPLSSPIFSKCL